MYVRMYIRLEASRNGTPGQAVESEREARPGGTGSWQDARDTMTMSALQADSRVQTWVCTWWVSRWVLEESRGR